MRKRIVPIIVGIIVIILVGGVTGFFLYPRYIDKQAMKLGAYIDDGEYDQALIIYKKYSTKGESFKEKVLDELREAVEKIGEKYMSEEIEYGFAQDQLKSLNGFDIIGFDLIVYDCAQWIDKIDASRENYQMGKTYYDEGNYDAALEKYGLVLKDDSKYYDLALEEINIILKEEVEKQKELSQLSWSVPSFDSTKYEHTYTDQDMEYMYATIEIPILIGDSPAYESINKILDSIREDYMEEINSIAEAAKDYMNEEYFKPSSFGIFYSVPYNKNGIVCIVLDGYTYEGGAHGLPILKALTFDLAKGSLMKLSDLIVSNTEEFAELINEEFQRMYNEAPEEYWEDAPSVVRANTLDIDSLNYYFTEDSICVYYFPYDLGSYARGFVDIVIPYRGNEEIFSFNYRQ